jgi:hypothetical protein
MGQYPVRFLYDQTINERWLMSKLDLIQILLILSAICSFGKYSTKFFADKGLLPYSQAQINPVSQDIAVLRYRQLMNSRYPF